MIYTDGLLERRGPGRELFGLPRLIETARSVLGQSAQAIVDHVFATVDAFGGTRAWDDDATLLVVRRLA